MNNNMNQLELHKKIEEFFKAGVKSVDVKTAQDLLTTNNDAKRFFFSQADENWLNWLWQNGFLNEIKNKAKDPTEYSYRIPGLDYLARMAEKAPAEVAQIIDSVKISEKNFNPEVIGRFLWIISSLPVEQIKKLTAKIRDEKWIYLMRSFRKSGYEFDGMIKKLVANKESKAIIELAQAILTVKDKSEVSGNNRFSMDSPFYVSDLSMTGIFEALANVGDSYVEKALQIMTDIMAEVVKLGEPEEDNKVFKYSDLLPLYDLDFFTLEIRDRESISYREDVKNFAATTKKLIERTIGKKCKNPTEAKALFKHIDNLPSCRSIWRLRLFTMAQCPKVFKEELKDAFFRLFDVKTYYDIEGGTEYKKALKICFSYLSNTDQRDYVKRVMDYFIKKDQEKENERENWHMGHGSRILSMITEQLTEKEKQAAKDVGFVLTPNYEPEPSIGKMRGGKVSHRPPVNLNDYSVEEIIKNLKDEWTPAKLNEQFKNDDFLTPRGVEGLGDALKEDIKKRTNEYLGRINSFFDRDNIHPHYLYSLLRGVEEMLRNKEPLRLEQISRLLGLFENIENAGKENPFKKGDDKSWLVDWIEVHKVIVDTLLYLLENKDKDKREKIHETHREQIKNLISYLFTIPDPIKEHEKPEYGDLYHVAINSVRGRTFESFVVFTENDGKELADDVKEIYKGTLKDDSLAVRFVIGRYLASFYFRGKEFVADLLTEIFPKDNSDKKDIYLATWEGYLSNNLYDKLFVALKDYYNHAITLDPDKYTQRKYSKGLDESLAVHLALAFVHLGLKKEDDLFVQFWNKPNVARHQEFISFIGRSYLTRDQASPQWLKDNKISEEKLVDFWDWALENVSEPKALSSFGFWVNPNREVLKDDEVIERMAQTLKKSDGHIDWDYGLLKRLSVFAEKDREKTLEIIKSYLLDSKGDINTNRTRPLLYRGEVKEAMKIIYKNGNKELKQKVTNLINTLIEKGSSMFWDLKEIF